MPLTEEDLRQVFEDLGIAYQIERHPPLFTVEESQALRGDLPGAHVKNMFLKDKKGGLWLTTCLEHRRFKIRSLEKAVGAQKMSFGKPDLLWDVLGVKPGAVTPLALANDRQGRQVNVILDAQMLLEDIINVHPLHNEATVAIQSADLLRFLDWTGHAPARVDFDALEAAAVG
ncbi:MAG: prolyl-tRNA synthetase associated domain-containing protein [Pseudomonadota bacterium]